MIRNILNLRYAANLDYAHRLVEGLDDTQANEAPVDGMNTPRWIIGHLAQTADQVGLGWVLEMERTIPEWDAWFDLGTLPGHLTADQPSLADAIDHLDRLHAVVSERVLASSPAFFERSLHDVAPERFRKRFPTVGNALAHIMLSHEMQHLGQLSAWRRVKGLPAV
ncbi:MAG: DinB family protein [Planctomycetota bacterium]